MAIPDTTTAAAFTLPKHRLHHAVSSKAEAGKISATDKTALDSAIDTLDAGLSGGSGAAARLDPSQMKSRIDGLIDNAVTSGTLTGDQATTLKGLFSRGSAQGDEAGPGVGGGPPPSGSRDSASGDARLEVAGTDPSSATDLLATFIKQLQSAQGQGSRYGATGSDGASQATGARVIDFEA